MKGKMTVSERRAHQWKRIGSKELYRKEIKGGSVWRSYGTDIACHYEGKLYMTERKYSATTSRHCSYIRQLYGISKEAQHNLKEYKALPGTYYTIED